LILSIATNRGLLARRETEGVREPERWLKVLMRDLDDVQIG
jgi:hypothetical protein